MADHQEMIHAAAAPAALYRGATRSSTTQASHGGDWWSTAVAPPVSSCSPEMPGLGAWSAAATAGGHVDGVDGNRSRSSNTASSDSELPGLNSLATGSSITFQESTGVADPATIAVPQTAAAGFATGWNQSFLDGSGFHGYMISSRSDQNHINTPSLMSPTPSSSNNNTMLQDSHDQNYQFLSNLGFELLSSPTSPYGGFRSSLLRSLTDPVASAVAKPNSPGFQQYQLTMNEAPAASIRQPLQFTNNTPFGNPSTGFATAVDGAALGAARPPPVQTRSASLAAKSGLEGVGDSSSVITYHKEGKRQSDAAQESDNRDTITIGNLQGEEREARGQDRITALQQLVSPFGMTDTASVLHETIEYIKFLHEQVGALSAPYLKNRPEQVPHLKSSTDKSMDGGEAAVKRDLTGRGLCLVPISSTFAVASETPVDFWTPFGAAFR